jgi:hypothetical protein
MDNLRNKRKKRWKTQDLLLHTYTHAYIHTCIHTYTRHPPATPIHMTATQYFAYSVTIQVAGKPTQQAQKAGKNTGSVERLPKKGRR